MRTLPYLFVFLSVPAMILGAAAGDRMTLSTSVERLRDANQSVRDDAAFSIRSALKRSPSAANDRGEAHWLAAFKAIRPGMSSATVAEALGVGSSGRLGAHAQGLDGSSSETWRLDDYWLVALSFGPPEAGLREIGDLSRKAREVWVEPPAGFTGAWAAYFVNGRAAFDIVYEAGRYRRFRAFYDNGQLAYEQTYANGVIEGLETGFYPNGKKMYEGRHASGQKDGKWIHWRSDGRKESELKYDHGREIGR